MDGLPDEILESILSYLTLKEAARTSVLSRRWRFLWTYFKGKIDFVEEDWKRIERDQLVTAMNEILKLHRGENVESFGIVIDEIDYSNEDFNYWIEFAAKKGVQMLQLILGSYSKMMNYWISDTIPQFLKRFSLESLQVLSLRFIQVNDEALGCFLTSSPNLQRLDLQYSMCLSNIVIPSSSLSLKELQVVDCMDLKKIEISARNLEIFTYLGPPISVEVKDVLHQLHTVYYGHVFHGITELRRSLPLIQLEKLTLDTPLLFLSFSLVGQNRELTEFESHGIRLRHQCLKVLKIVNFARIPEVVGFTKAVLDKAESPEMLILVVSNNCSICPQILEHGNSTGQLLEHGFLPTGIELKVESVCQGICRVQRNPNIFPRNTLFGRTFDMDSGTVL